MSILTMEPEPMRGEREDTPRVWGFLHPGGWETGAPMTATTRAPSKDRNRQPQFGQRSFHAPARALSLWKPPREPHNERMALERRPGLAGRDPRW